MTPLSGTLSSASRLFSSSSSSSSTATSNSRSRGRTQISTLNTNSRTSSSSAVPATATPITVTRTTSSTESLPPINRSASFVPSGETMQRAGRSISEGRFRLPISFFGSGGKGTHRRQKSRDSTGRISTSSSVSMSTSASQNKGMPPPPPLPLPVPSLTGKSSSGFVLNADTGLTSTTLINVEQQCALYDRSLMRNSSATTTIDANDRLDGSSSSFKMITTQTIPLSLNVNDNGSQYTTSDQFHSGRRPAPIDIPMKSPTSPHMDSGIGSMGSSNTPTANGSPSHLAYSSRFSHRRGSDSFLFDMPLRAGPSGYAWNGTTGQSVSIKSASMSRDPRRHASERPYLNSGNHSRTTSDHSKSASCSTSPRHSNHSVVAVAGRFASPAIPALMAQDYAIDDRFDDINSTNSGSNTSNPLLSPASPDILGTSPPGVHAWRRRRSLTPGPISTHISPSVSYTAPLSAQYPLGANKTLSNPSLNDKQSESRLELWEARRQLRALGGLDELLAQPDATVKCTLTPVVCRDPYRLNPLNLRVEEEDEDDEDDEENEDDHALEDDHEDVFCVDGEEASLAMRPLGDPARAWWNRSLERHARTTKWTSEQRGKRSISENNNIFAIPSAAPMERAATLPRTAAAINNLLCKDDDLMAQNAFKQ
ncbi:hypothetical protein BDF22DRAFT_743731 [Syncephalis plumigaleata]|nr:hypothetical protein BDF22DRAFT_743731 [Syncephalis plumigaleata]